MNRASQRPAALHIGPDDLAEIARHNPRASLVDQVFVAVAGRVQSRQASAGARLPSVRELADACAISRDTAARAFERLVAHGLVEARRGSGYYVRAAARRGAPAAARPALFGPAATGVSRWRMLLVKPDAALASRIGSGCLPESWCDDDTLAAALRALARQSSRGLAQYSDPRGYLPLRQQLQVKLHEAGVLTDVDNILVTNGATEALHLVAQTYLRDAGMPVLVERPGPPLLPDRLLSTGLEMHAVPRLADGPDLEVMRDLCEKHRPRVFFVSSVLHNPTCTQMAPHKAFQLLRLAEEFDLTLVEDDSYGDLMPQGKGPLTRLATLDQLKRVIHVGSFSKTLGPGLRCGFLAADAERMGWLMTYRSVQCIGGSSLSERLLYKVLSGGNYRRHCEHLRNRLAEVRAPVLAELERWGLKVDRPDEGGLYLWTHLGAGVDAMQVAERMLEQGHLLAPGRVFCGGSSRFDEYVRINVAEAHQSPALPALGKLLGRRG